MKTILPILFTLFLVPVVNAQELHSLEPISKHYQSLQQLSAEPDPEKSDLDKITYPMEGKATGKQFIGMAPVYLKDDEVIALKQTVTFPANSSKQTRAELDYLLQWQEQRSEQNRDRALEIARVGYWPPLPENSSKYGNVEDLFWECEWVIGSSCTPSNYPASMHLLAGVTRDMRIMEFTMKYHHLRPRPYHLEPKLKPLGRVSNPSFVSGHTLWAYIQAFTWSELIPDQRAKFLALAWEVGESREIMGIHYPSDEEAARVLAHKMLEFMFKNEEFRKDLETAKAEWK